MVSERKEGGGVFDKLRHADMEQDRSILDAPVAPLPNPGEGGPVYSGEADGPVPVIPWPNPDDDGHVPVAPLPNPGEGGPVSPGNVIQPLPVQPLPTITYAADSLSKRGLRAIPPSASMWATVGRPAC